MSIGSVVQQGQGGLHQGKGSFRRVDFNSWDAFAKSCLHVPFSGHRLPGHPVSVTRLLAPSLFATLQQVLALWEFAFMPQWSISAPHTLTVLLHSLQIGIADQMHDVFEPQSLSMQQAEIGDSARRPRQLLLLFPLENLFQLLILNHFQNDFGDSLSKALLLRPAVIGSSILTKEFPKQQPVFCLHDPFICFHLEEPGKRKEKK